MAHPKLKWKHWRDRELVLDDGNKFIMTGDQLGLLVVVELSDWLDHKKADETKELMNACEALAKVRKSCIAVVIDRNLEKARGILSQLEREGELIPDVMVAFDEKGQCDVPPFLG